MMIVFFRVDDLGGDHVDYDDVGGCSYHQHGHRQDLGYYHHRNNHQHGRPRLTVLSSTSSSSK